MKTVPYLSPEREESTILSTNKVAIDRELPKKMNGHTAEFSDLFKQDSPFRFMKIHTRLLEKEGIHRDDIAVIDPEGIPVTGKIVVVKVGDTLMIRRYEKIKNGFLLHADAQKVSSLIIESGHDQSEIVGVVTFIIKSF